MIATKNNRYNETKRVEREQETIKQIKNTNALLRQMKPSSNTDESTNNNKSSVSFEHKRLQNEANWYQKRIKIERDKIAKIDQEIQHQQTIILQQQKKVGGNDSSSKHNKIMIDKQVRILENRLNQTLVKFNEKVAQNRDLRRKIDDLRQERVVYDGIYKKLERELHEKTTEMEETINDGHAACKARDKARSEVLTLKRQVEESNLLFEQDYQELNRLVKTDQDIQKKEQNDDKEIYKGDGNRLSTTKGENRRKNRLEYFPQTPTKSAIDKENATLSTCHNSDSDHKEEEHDPISMTENQMKDCEESLAKITELTGITDVNEMVTKFLEMEEKNFSVFNYVTHELNGEIECLESQIVTAKKEIEQSKGHGINEDTKRKKMLKTLEEKRLRMDVKGDECEEQYNAEKIILEQLKTGIGSIFTCIGCANSITGGVDELLGTQGVTESNVMQYLRLIEKRTAGILQEYASSQASATSSVRLEDATPEVKRTSDVQMTVNPPAADDFSSGDDSDQEEDERPLTREELKLKARRGIKC